MPSTLQLSRTHCPACKTATLEVYSHDDNEIDRCNSCHGLWFDEPQLMDYIEDHSGEDGKFTLINDKNRQGQGSRYCCSCEKPMDEYQLIDDYPLKIDACRGCDTFWIDIEEINHVKHSKSLQQALMRINKKFTWRSWLFQLLSKMPVEYNAEPRQTPWVTYTLLALNFLLFSLSYTNLNASNWTYSNLPTIYPFDSVTQFSFSIISAQFMHIDLWHILGNMYFLWIIGDNIEDAIGKLRFIILYLGCGAIGFLLEISLIAYQQKEIYLLGASAAVSALFGMYLIWFRHAKLSVMLFILQFRLPAIVFFLIWLAGNLYGFFLGTPGIAFLAHLGGFFAGLLAGLIYQKRVYEHNPLLKLLNGPAPINK